MRDMETLWGFIYEALPGQSPKNSPADRVFEKTRLFLASIHDDIVAVYCRTVMKRIPAASEPGPSIPHPKLQSKPRYIQRISVLVTLFAL